MDKLLLSISCPPSSLSSSSFFFSSRRRHTRYIGDWSSDVCSSDLALTASATAASLRARPWLPPSIQAWLTGPGMARSEERRVGKEGRCRWSPGHYKKNETKGGRDEAQAG